MNQPVGKLNQLLHYLLSLLCRRDESEVSIKRKELRLSQPNQQSLPKLPDAKLQASLKPIILAGLWQEVTVNDEDIEQARAMMWSDFGEMPNE